MAGDEHVKDLAVLFDGPGYVPPDAVDLDAGLAGKPSVTGGMPARSGSVDQLPRESLDPPEQGHVDHLDTSFGEELLQVQVRQGLT